MNRYLIRGIFFSCASLGLAVYESIMVAPPRVELFLGYGLVFAYGIFTILTRHRRPGEAPTESDE